MTNATLPDSAAPPLRTHATVTVVIPTYREAENIPSLAARFRTFRDSSGIDLQVLLMDDNSQDGSAEKIAELDIPWINLVTRTGARSLSQAVLEGMLSTTSDVLVAMDADLSHPPEKIPDLLRTLDEGAEIAVGSRFAEGGTTADNWGIARWLNSRIATLLALPLASLSDPMSGFFALRRSTLTAGRDFNPVGYKILLELIIKCRCKRIAEIPIHFDNRRFGKSKLSLSEQLKYIRHLRRLYMYKYGTWSHLAQFVVVGCSGLVVNLGVLTVLLQAGIANKVAIAAAIAISMLWNFVLNRRFSFSYARDGSIARQFLGFVAASSLGAVVNYATTIEVWHLIRYKQMAALIGVLAGTSFNFIASRFVVFRTKHIKY
jgi:dolichol-phosphate mannosyltransferase